MNENNKQQKDLDHFWDELVKKSEVTEQYPKKGSKEFKNLGILRTKSTQESKKKEISQFQPDVWFEQHVLIGILVIFLGILIGYFAYLRHVPSRSIKNGTIQSQNLFYKKSNK